MSLTGSRSAPSSPISSDETLDISGLFLSPWLSSLKPFMASLHQSLQLRGSARCSALSTWQSYSTSAIVSSKRF
ncbi:hypothetical protein PoB_004457300 [Plakobranchus ocellatus]|uniref:Uncharacterized protein n=1 Tax=Plakobranchus ocellatus TaxID=259542 RepID=A0AAV4BEP8_9GAST|nr:hypothetical protein PoB_004457300 [Plakobranchus ocellatus]